jgi:methyltransferase-like protein/2-polyprenyl-3-methyl-5-hydroxy-6-metoxy-1,4-benzoquinol methylase
MNDPTTAYDEIAYPGRSFASTHPDRLATIATLFGMTAAAVERCRVLELGCGDGANLIPMAYALPESSFFGVDLAARPIASGQKMIHTLGLRNVELAQLNVMDLTPDHGQFDYIIAHGLYSWVPPAVQEKVLSICRENLAPAGVAFISHLVYPGSHLRDMFREMMLFHVRDLAQPAARINQARALIKFIADSPAGSDVYRLFSQSFSEELSRLLDGFLFHDYLADINAPAYFVQFAERAAKHGLQFLGEADFFEMQYDYDIYPSRLRDVLRQLESQNVILKEQYLDFLKCRRFRQTLLCHGEVSLDRLPKPERLANLYAASPVRPASPDPDLASHRAEEFRSPKGGTISIDHPAAKAALAQLGSVWPRAVGFTELLTHARSRAGLAPDDQARDAQVLGHVLLKCYAAGYVELHAHAPRFATTVSERPVASPVARYQILNDSVVTNLRHVAVSIEDSLCALMLKLLDGTRDRQALLNDLVAPVASGAAVIERDGQPITDPEQARAIIAGGLENNLAGFAQNALLVA